ncbi:hypothetical protein F4823DRAFT_568846 [Ustulina deusta]|nr:hypothetical protein F4823DRAFT_568846 [Ustulina deusta]
MPVCRDHLDHEVWETEDLNDIFKRITEQARPDTTFCFFTGGLDEYDGEEKDLIPLLQPLSITRHITICASSQPGRQCEKFLRNYNRTFDMSKFTKEYKRRYINTHLIL